MSGQRRRGPMGGRGMRPTEKAKDFKGAMGKLFRYMGRYKLRFVMVFIFAIAGTIFMRAKDNRFSDRISIYLP